jgi:hypothetical protein
MLIHRLGNPDEPMVYQIRIRGQLGAAWADWFEGLTITLEKDGDTLLTGRVIDQAALHGLLRKIRDLGIPLVSVNQIPINETHPSCSGKEMNMKTLQKFGGFAALYLAVAYLIGMAIFLVVLDYPSITDPAQKAALLVEMQTVIFSTNLLMYVFFGFFLVVLSLALYDRLKSGARAIMQVATAVGIIWAGSLIASGMVANAGIAPVVALYAHDPAQAALTWQGIEAVANGLGNANGEILGGLWVLLVSVAALRAGGLPKGLNVLGLLVGAVGIISIVPGLTDLMIGVFGLSQIIWFAWLGIVLLRSNPGTTA